ncbi:porin [Thiohalomonas denitrificans]|uniref:Outer membrane protein (Porin) n=1 Tax=Thiohalomonas denitrificans TaxID=415747 RepID=A0A1G5QHX9_9GAMM|nr:porin [Thiohalomonas denitrificans]SCZ61337.1 Outer membrane protein (porin) [Thiohalomonas denitrificans]
MNKKLIALAIAGAMAAPLAAHAELTISGKLQAEVVNVDGDGATLEGIQVVDGMEGSTANSGNASAINFAGSQDLGNGLKGIVKAGFNLKPADRVGIDMRDGYVGLAGGFGTVLVGSMNSPYKASTVGWDPFLATSLQARGSTGMSGLHNGYLSNTIAYGNTFGAAKFSAAVAVDETDDGTGDTQGDHTISASLNVPVGPVEVAVAYQDEGGDNETAVKGGVKYSTGVFTVAGQYETLDEGLSDGDHMYLTGSMAMGANTFSLSAGSFTDDSATPNDADYVALGVKHAFNKAVSAHVGYRMNDDDAGADVNVLAAGMRVGF